LVADTGAVLRHDLTQLLTRQVVHPGALQQDRESAPFYEPGTANESRKCESLTPCPRSVSFLVPLTVSLVTGRRRGSGSGALLFSAGVHLTPQCHTPGNIRGERRRPGISPGLCK